MLSSDGYVEISFKSHTTGEAFPIRYNPFWNYTPDTWYARNTGAIITGKFELRLA